MERAHHVLPEALNRRAVDFRFVVDPLLKHCVCNSGNLNLDLLGDLEVDKASLLYGSGCLPINFQDVYFLPPVVLGVDLGVEASVDQSVDLLGGQRLGGVVEVVKGEGALGGNGSLLLEFAHFDFDLSTLRDEGKRGDIPHRNPHICPEVVGVISADHIGEHIVNLYLILRVEENAVGQIDEGEVVAVEGVEPCVPVGVK